MKLKYLEKSDFLNSIKFFPFLPSFSSFFGFIYFFLHFISLNKFDVLIVQYSTFGTNVSIHQRFMVL